MVLGYLHVVEFIRYEGKSLGDDLEMKSLTQFNCFMGKRRL